MAEKKTFYVRALNQFRNQVQRSYQRFMNWYKNAYNYVHQYNEQLVRWLKENRLSIILTIGIIVCVCVIILFISDVRKGAIEEAGKVGVGGVIGAPLLGLVIGSVSALLFYVLLFLIDWLLLIIIYAVLFSPVLIGAIFYGLYLVALVIMQFILLLPLTILVLLNGAWLLWRRIFYTCPNIECTYRGLPIHICDKCGRQHEKLWPNIYGLFYHPCSCGHKLPTFDWWERNKLDRLCTRCKTELPKVKLPEKLIALVGGPSVGKTVFLLSSTQILRNGVSPKQISATSIVPKQREELNSGIKNLKSGVPPAKTDALLRNAYLFRLNQNGKKSLFYYYDAQGEEFSSIDRHGRRENVKYLDGIILLVDPFCLPGLRDEARKEGEGISASKAPLEDIVASTVGALKRIRQDQQYSIPLAVVITKADAKAVRDELGDITHRVPGGAQCFKFLMKFGAGNSLRLLKQHFKNINFFACSALGRTPIKTVHRPFKAYGVMEPLLWILKR